MSPAHRYARLTWRDRAQLVFTRDFLNGAAREAAVGADHVVLPRPSAARFWQGHASITRPRDSQLTYSYPVGERFALMIANEDGSPGIDAFVWVSVQLIDPAGFDWAMGAAAAALALLGMAVGSTTWPSRQ